MDHISMLRERASWLMREGKGILAADESIHTMNERLAAVSVSETAEMRRVYRELLFTAPRIEQYLSGVIMFEGTVREGRTDGVTFPDVLSARGIVPGAKVDHGTVDIPEFPGEKVTQGLDDLHERLWEYANLGVFFAKWRAVISIGDSTPTDASIALNAVMLARYASLCHQAGIVPMIEPEVLMHGNHDAARAEEVTTRTLQLVFATLREYKIDLSAVILKTSMVLAGDMYKEQTPAEEVADRTLRTLRLSVPYEVPGIVFLSGGQTPVRATENLNAIATRGKQPWPITFSYSRAIEEPVLAVWKGDNDNSADAQAVLLHRLRMNALARDGKYTSEKEKEFRL